VFRWVNVALKQAFVPQEDKQSKRAPRAQATSGSQATSVVATTPVVAPPVLVSTPVVTSTPVEVDDNDMEVVSEDADDLEEEEGTQTTPLFSQASNASVPSSLDTEVAAKQVPKRARESQVDNRGPRKRDKPAAAAPGSEQVETDLVASLVAAMPSGPPPTSE